MTTKWLVFSLAIIIAIQACSDQAPGDPKVVTLAASDVVNYNATLNGEIQNSGQLVEAFGFLVSTAPNVNLDNYILSKSFEGSRFGKYSVGITLSHPLKEHYYVAVAREKGELVYGNEVAFTTGTFTLPTSTSTLDVTGFLPASGPAGTIVTIAGSGFSSIAAYNVVAFGTVEANVKNSSTKTRLFVVVPQGLTNKSVPISLIVKGLSIDQTWKSSTSFTIIP